MIDIKVMECNIANIKKVVDTTIYRITTHAYLNDTFEIIGERDNNMHYLLFHAMEKSDLSIDRHLKNVQLKSMSSEASLNFANTLSARTNCLFN